ncbi:transcriptional protein SWT1 isoform X2 [Centroberyx affinis]|uniref:transcriptional protein SWT1 isoform X2 n=1 Tax=Centroberyx affinis TaxID=166261 RepID=UPI003A5BA5BA
MSKKKSKKKKSKRLPSSSSEEDDKASKEQDVTKKSKSARRKQHGSSHDRCTEKQENSLTVKDASRSSRQIKKALCRLAKTAATDQRPCEKKEECAPTKSVSMPCHGESCSSQAKANISGKGAFVTVGKTVERGPSKPTSTHSPQRTEKTSQGNLHNISSQRSPSKLTKKLMSHSFVSAEQKEQRQISLKRRCIPEEPPRTEKDSKTAKTREPSETSSLSNDLRETRRKLLKRISKEHREEVLKAKRNLCAGAKSSSTAATEQSCTLAKHSTSHSSSNVCKHLPSKQGSVTPLVSHKTAKLPSPPAPTVRLNFKIPKKPLPVDGTIWNNDDGVPKNSKKRTSATEPSQSGSSVNNTKQGTVQGVHRSAVVTAASPCEGQDERSSVSGQLLTLTCTNTSPHHDQRQVVEGLHLARSEKRLEVDVMQSYGELTCMEIDPPEQGATDTLGKQPLQQDLILVLDTNILLSHLDYVKKIRSLGLGALGLPVVLIPWVVLQELDSLKMRNRLSDSHQAGEAHLACPAIKYIYSSLKSREPRLWGQSMQQAAQSSYGLTTENNDDRVLQCCLQYQSLYPECALILCTNDKNLCCKALLSGVKALSKDDFAEEVERSRHGLQPPQCMETPMLPQPNLQVPAPMLRRIGLFLGPMEKDNMRLSEGGKEEEQRKGELSRCVSELEDCLREALSEVLEVEMKAVYEDCWVEIVYLKPPWTLQDILQCLKKHWLAVFGFIVPRKKLQAVLNLIDFFTSGKTVEWSTTLVALHEAKELMAAFGKRSSHARAALSVLDNIRLQTQGESPVNDAVMSDDEEKQATATQVSHQEVWALFENIWANMYQTRFLSSDSGLEETQAFLSFIHSSEIVPMESRFTAKDLLDCFSQQEYRERLRIGGTQLMELKVALDRCVEAMGQHITHTT